MADEPHLNHPVTLAFRGDWGQANMHRIRGWLAQEIGDRSPAGSEFAIWSGRGGSDQLAALRAGRADNAGSVTAGGAAVQVHRGDHAVIHPDLPNVTNNAYQVGDLLFHPGDSFTLPSGPVRILLLPAGGPWMKLSESADYLRAVAPQIAVPIHQAGLADIHRQLHYQLFRGLAPSGTTVHVLD